jgi:hypothetical protein
VSRAREAYELRARGPNHKFRLVIGCGYGLFTTWEDSDNADNFAHHSRISDKSCSLDFTSLRFEDVGLI